MKTRRKIFGFIAGIMLLTSIFLVRFGKHIKPRQADHMIEVVVESMDDLGKMNTILETLSVSSDSLERIAFSKCTQKSNILRKNYIDEIDRCYDQALKTSAQNNSTFGEVLIRMKRSIDEIKDNHVFLMEIQEISLRNTAVDFDSIWNAHFIKPSKIDLGYKEVLQSYFQNRVAIQESLRSSEELFKTIEEIQKSQSEN